MRWGLVVKALWKQYPKTMVGLTAAGVGLVAYAAWPCSTCGTGSAAEAEVAASTDGKLPPRAIIGKFWLDHYPKNAKDEVQYLIFAGSGYGISEKGSRWRGTYDTFEFERSGERLSMTWLHDGKKQKNRFSVSHCDAPPPFEICLELKKPVGGTKRYYSWDDPDDAAEHLSTERLQRHLGAR